MELTDTERGDLQVRGQRVYGKSLFLPLSFSVNLKQLLKQSFKKGVCGECLTVLLLL